jgi:hypothetical protein
VRRGVRHSDGNRRVVDDVERLDELVCDGVFESVRILRCEVARLDQEPVFELLLQLPVAYRQPRKQDRDTEADNDKDEQEEDVVALAPVLQQCHFFGVIWSLLSPLRSP